MKAFHLIRTVSVQHIVYTLYFVSLVKEDAGSQKQKQLHKSSAMLVIVSTASSDAQAMEYGKSQPASPPIVFHLQHTTLSMGTHSESQTGLN